MIGSTVADHAAAYARLGWRVVPIVAGEKRPAITNWTQKATTDTDTIDNWFNDRTTSGIGIATGAGSGIWVLDIDVADGKPGWHNFQALLAEHHEPMPRTVVAQTGSGGFHYYFRWDPHRPVTNGMATRLRPGLDIRGEGGQVVAAPTVHPSGSQYMWIVTPWEEDVAEAPYWLYDLILPEPEPEQAIDDATWDRVTIIDVEGRPVTSIPVADFDGPSRNGDSHNETPADYYRRTTNWVTLLSEHGWALSHTRGNETYWTRPGKEPRHGHSAVTHGEDGPLVIWSSEAPAELWNIGTPTSDRSGVTVSKFDFYAATQHGGDRGEAALAVRATMPKPPKPTPAEPDPGRIASKMRTVADVLAIDPPEPMIGDWLDKGMLATMPGKYGSLKSFLAMGMCFSVVTGKRWLGQQIHHTGPAVYCSLEGGYTLQARYRGWMVHHHVETHELDNLYTWVEPLNLLDHDEINQFCDWLADIKPDLIVIDTYSRATPGADENAKPDVSKAIQAMEKMRQAAEAAVLITHHTGHNATGRGRGFSGLEDDIDVVLPVEGQAKDGPVKLTSAKQKARENPQPIYLTLAHTDDNDPVLVTTEPDDDDDDVVIGPQLRADILTKVELHPGRLTKTDLHGSTFGVGHRDRVRLAVDHLIGSGELVVRNWRHPDTSQTKDRLYVPRDVDWRTE